MSPRVRVFVSTLPLVTPGCLALAFVDHRGAEHLVLGYIFGTIFAHTTLAAAWTAFGPLPLLWRVPLSLLWIVSLSAAFAVNIGLHGGPDARVVVIVVACIVGQWLIVQLPLWALAISYSLRLRHKSEAQRPANPRDLQFGIRELMIFTAIVGVCFGIGRAVVVYLAPRLSAGSSGEAPIFIFLAVTAIVLTLPLLLAAFLRRFSLLAVMLVMILIGLATACELPLLNLFHKGPGPDMFHLIFINTFTTLWVLLITQVVRLNGFRLVAASEGGDSKADG